MRIGPSRANHDPFTVKPRGCHVHNTIQVTPPTSPCTTLSADAESARMRPVTIFSVQCTVWCNWMCTIGLYKGLSKICKPFASLLQEKGFVFDRQPLAKVTVDHELALPLPGFQVDAVSWKVWPTLVTTQQVGIYPKILLGFTSFPVPIYHVLRLKTTELQLWLVCN